MAGEGDAQAREDQKPEEPEEGAVRDPQALFEAGLFRAAPVARVLAGFAAVFAEGVDVIAAGGGASGSLLTPRTLKRELSTNSDSGSQRAPAAGGADGEHRLADAVFYGSPATRSVDFFISHVWTTPRWQKLLGISFYVSVRVACGAAGATWLGSAAVLVLLHGYSAYGGRGSLLLPCLVYLPVTVFMVFFVFGHVLVPCIGRRRAWLDKLCIHQSRADLKVDGVTALPAFVRNSARMLILWDETYFERLWCNAEVAIFCSTKGVSNIDFVPMWLAPWVLTTIALDLVSISLLDHLLWLIPACGEFFTAKLGGSCPLLVGWLTQTFGIGISIGLAYLPMTPFSYYSFSKKIETHDLMVRHMKEYSLAAAKCAVESDRAIVEEDIAKLFMHKAELGYNSEAPSAGPIERFNHYINTDFAEAITEQVGSVTHMPYFTCCLVFMPLMFESLANVMGCDSMPCEVSYKEEGYASIPQFMFTNAVMWCFGMILIYPTTYPVMLKGLVWCKRKLHQAPHCSGIASVLVIMASYLYMGFLMGAVCGVVGIVATSRDLASCVVLMLLTAVLIGWNWFLFKTKSSGKGQHHPGIPSYASLQF